MTDINQKAWKYIYRRTMEENDYSAKIALTNGKRSYTYNQFFQNCRKYASVFSALGMTKKNKSRVGLIGTSSAETIISLYGLNMTGAEVSLISSLSIFKAERIIEVVEKERLTDLVITDDFFQEKTLRRIVQKKDELGLRFIILLHPPMCGCAVPSPIAVAFEQKSAVTRSLWGPLYMDFLLNVYGRWPVSYDDSESSDSAVIIHTSGTTGGSSNPVVMSDRAINAACNNMVNIDGYDELKEDLILGLMLNIGNAYGFIVQVHFPLALGGNIIIIPGNTLNPLFYRAISHYKFSLLFCNSIVFDMWMKYPKQTDFDFSSLRLVILGGTYVSVADKKRFREFLMKHGGSDIPILNGYGISELGGVCALSSADINDESVGRLINGFEARFFDEETEEYLSIEDAPLKGVLYLNSDSMTSLFLNGKQIVKTKEIDGKNFICTNDLMSVDSQGKLTYLGRSNRYFMNNEGIKYPSGRVETELSNQDGIENCGIVPVFDKLIHDNVPMLCVTITGNDDPLETVRNAMLSVFKEGGSLPADYIPFFLLIAKSLPRNANGKIDLFKLSKGEVEGIKYLIECTKNNNKVIGFTFKDVKEEDDDYLLQNIYKDIAKDIMDESVPGQIYNNIKSSNISHNSAVAGPMQPFQMMNSIYRAYCNTKTWWLYQMYYFNMFT